MISAAPIRVLLLWCPGWPVLAARLVQGIAADRALALTDRGVVVACSPAAQAEGVAVGLRVRQAQHRCPDLVVLPHDVAAETRAFEPVLRAIEEKIPDVHVVRPGLAAVKARGAGRFYGSEEAAAHALLTHLQRFTADELRLPVDLRMAVADGLFTAEHAAYSSSARQPLVVVPTGRSRDFLAGLPVSVACDRRLANLLQRMGIRTLGDLAKLPRAQVNSRFGAPGLRAHQLASGEDSPILRPRVVPPELGLHVAFDPPAAQIEQIVLRCEPAAEGFVQLLTRSALICTEIRVTVQLEPDALFERLWRHPWQFGKTEVLDRIRWQLEDLATEAVTTDDETLGASVLSVQVLPESVDNAEHHAQGLWGDRPDEKVEHALTTLQHRLGHESVLTSTVAGGRLLHERRVLRPWGDALPTLRERRLEQPWPGTVPGPSPATVFSSASQVQVLSADGAPITVDERGTVNERPTWLRTHEGQRRIEQWAGPWPIRQRWWRKVKQLNRFQLVDNHLTAWLLLSDGAVWFTEARYD
ncbi:DNA polymerase Y family protein [Flexivirga caeni]|uniref:DNA polymerase Y family protein n=1 Tax=Flexivirga caeni TaxID=2294115 RepID=A0A3M9M9N9_9MICO|nr:DNA polymerase Y family protein [Flexivirga caeni]RNI22290.1 DNA polymerase Y family protein [Flexivirga caeni]